MRYTLRIKKILRRFGYDLVKFQPWSHPVAQRRRLLESARVDLVLDVGANTGDFAFELRSWGYGGRIVSFEPVRETFGKLGKAAGRDPRWSVMNFALGELDGEKEIHLSKNTLSSSLLAMSGAHVESEPESRYVGTETIQVRRLDSLFPTLREQAQTVFLKIDAQGYERWVLEGARQSLSDIQLIQVEMPLVPLYEGEMSWMDMVRHLQGLGYRLVGLETVFTDPRSGETLQIDGVFRRDSASPVSPR